MMTTFGDMSTLEKRVNLLAVAIPFAATLADKAATLAAELLR